jgi:hypothetical protein
LTFQARLVVTYVLRKTYRLQQALALNPGAKPLRVTFSGWQVNWP